MVFWNAGALRARAVVNGGTLPESVRKFEWLLATFNGGNRPDVIFIAEVTGSVQELGELRRWIRQRLKYDVRWLPGEGGSRRVDGVGISHANGIIAIGRRAKPELLQIFDGSGGRPGCEPWLRGLQVGRMVDAEVVASGCNLRGNGGGRAG